MGILRFEPQRAKATTHISIIQRMKYYFNQSRMVVHVNATYPTQLLSLRYLDSGVR